VAVRAKPIDGTASTGQTNTIVTIDFPRMPPV